MAQQHRTRSGKAFRATEQTSPWAEASEALLVLQDYLDWDSMLTARGVCQAWRSSFSTPVRGLQLQQPATAKAGLALGRKAAAAFSSATTLHLTLLHVQEPAVDLTADDEPPVLHGPASLWRPAAGAALLRQLSKSGRLQQLQLVADAHLSCQFPCLSVLLKAAPQLRVLDLSCCKHDPADLLVLAQHACGLQELLLHCQAFNTLSGRRIRHGEKEWCRKGGNTPYQPQHIAALANLPQLQLLEIPLPVELMHRPEQRQARAVAKWFDAVGRLTRLTSLHAIHHGSCVGLFVPGAAVAAGLSRLTQLRQLRCNAGGPAWSIPTADKQQLGSERNGQAQCWGAVLPCLPHLTRLELPYACVDDALLQAVGSNSKSLQRLVLGGWVQGCSKAGADAVAHVGHIELYGKDFECSKNLQLLQLPAVKVGGLGVRFHHLIALRQLGDEPFVAWTQETCPCWRCWHARTRVADA